MVVERRVLGHVAYRTADRERVGNYVMARNFDAPVCRHKVAGEHAKDRALARAIGPEQADNLALFDCKGNVGYGAAWPLPLGHMLRQHNGRHPASQNTNAENNRAIDLEYDPGRDARDSDPFTAPDVPAITHRIRESVCVL